MNASVKANRGLEGVVAAETRLSMVDGEAGELLIGGYPVAELAMSATFEETVWLLWHGALPDRATLSEFQKTLASRRELPEATLALLRAATHVPAMDALLMATPTLALGRDRDDESDAVTLVAAFPAVVAAHHRLARGLEPIAPRPELGHSANYLWMLSGEMPDAERVRGMETYLNTVVDHGLAASTFAARVIVSTESDLVSAIAGALGAMKGPLHGGAPGPALDMVFEIGEAPRAEEVLRRKIEAGEKLMGFGHRVYKVRDPRADVLAAAAERMFTRGGDMRLYELAKHVEATAIRLLEEYKPGRRLQTNVEFYTALLLHGLGLDVPLFTPTFSVARVAGWLAHCFEQRRDNRIIRPQSVYVGERRRFAA
ncbi:MAG TPA: citrate synthase/methylcitrate synthase [Thermoanaerobaculia bacterium]|nr:citrate synthase/methylcitrate synthase [Thermoanaerobaculia bacterium]